MTRAGALFDDVQDAIFILFAATLTARVVERTLLAIALLNISLQIQKHFLLRTDVSDLGSLGGLQVSLTNLSLIWLYLMWMIGALVRSRMPSVRSRHAGRSGGLIAVGGLVVAMYAMSLLAARDRELATFEVVYIIEQFLLLIYIANTTASRQDVVFIVRVLIIGMIIQSVLMLAQISGVVGNLNAFGITARAEFAGDARVSGTIGSPNTAAAYLGLTMVLSLSLFLGGLPRRDRWLAGIGFALALLPMIFTGSRGGWMQLILAIGVLAIAARRSLPLRKMAAAAVLLTVVVLPFRATVLDRVSGDDNGSAESRMPMNRLALAMISDHPILGVGANNYALAMEPYTGDFRGVFFYTVHNKFLLVLAETGVFGLAAFVAFLGAIIRDGWRVWKLRDPVMSPIAIGCVAAITGLMLQMNVEPARTDPYSHMLWLCGGLVLAMRRIAAERGQDAGSGRAVRCRLNEPARVYQ